MKIQIRKNVFETNSSSVHSMTLCTGDDYKKFSNGEILYDIVENKLVNKNDLTNPDEVYTDWDDKEYKRYMTEKEFVEYIEEYYDYTMDTFCEKHLLSNGEEIWAFGYYGHD